MSKQSSTLPDRPTAYELHRHQVFSDPAFRHHVELLLEAADTDEASAELIQELTNAVAKQHRIAFDDIVRFVKNGLQEPKIPPTEGTRLMISPESRTFAISFGIDATEVEVREQFKIFKDYRKQYMSDIKQKRRGAPRDPEFLHALRRMRQNRVPWKEIERAYEAEELPPTQGKYYGKDDLMRYYYEHPYPDIPQ